MSKQRLFVDMDGTLAVFTPTKELETLYEKGYFVGLEPMVKVVEAVKNIVAENKEIEVYILSAVLSDSQYALAEKNQWLDKYLPEIPKENRVFMPCGQDKKDFIPDGIKRNDFLLDDYTKNLTQWQPPARGIKLLNGINHTNGTWQHDRISGFRESDNLARCIIDVMADKERCFDDKETNGKKSLSMFEQEIKKEKSQPMQRKEAEASEKFKEKVTKER